MTLNRVINRFVDAVFELFLSKDKTRLYLLGVLFIALFLRIIAAINLRVFADDMHFAVHAINFINSGKLVVYDQSASLWYYLTDIAYNLFGATQLGSRSVAILFGTASILAIFLFTREFFDKRTALAGAFLLAISGFHIRNTLAEMDVLAMFFVISGATYFIKATKRNYSWKLLSISGVLFGLSIVTKAYVILYLPVLLGYAIYIRNRSNERLLSSPFLKSLLVFLVVAGLFAIPTLTHNYLLYKDKGIMDYLFTNNLGFGREAAAQYYSWDTSWGLKADWKGLVLGNSIHTGGSPWPTTLYALGFVLRTDPLIFFAGLIGIVLCFKRSRPFLIFSGLTFIFVFLFLAAKVLMLKHYIFLLYIFVPLAALTFVELNDLLKKKIKSYRAGYLFGFLLLFSLLYLGISQVGPTQFYATSSTQQIMSFIGTLPEDSLIVADARIYRGEIHWMFNGRNYIESAHLGSLLALSEQEGSRPENVKVYFVECVFDDCGWGTIASQPEFNQSTEQMVSYFANTSQILKEASIPPEGKPYIPLILSAEKSVRLRVYGTTLMLDPRTLAATKQLKTWFLYPIGYDESISPIFDNYKVRGFFDGLLNKFAHGILYLAIFLSLVAPFLLLRDAFRSQ